MAEDRVTLPLDIRKQRALLGHIILDPIFYQQCAVRVEPEWFSSGPLSKVYKAVSSWWATYKRLPTVDELLGYKEIAQYDAEDRATLHTTINDAVAETDNYKVDGLRNELAYWLSARIYRTGVLESERAYNLGKFDECYSIINKRLKELNEAKFVQDIAKSFADPVSFLKKMETRYDDAITFGIKALDDAMMPTGMDSGPAGQSKGLLLGDTTILLAPANVGKCVKLNTPIMVVDGTVKKVQDIIVGDLLMGPDGLPRKVLSITRGRGQMYDIVPKSGGDTWGCNDAHILNLRCVHPRPKNGDRAAHNRKFYDGATENISVSDYLQTNREYKTHMRLWRAGLEFEEKSLPVPPYILGLWLGDGHSGCSAITSMDEPIVNEWKRWVNNIGCITREYPIGRANKTKTYRAASVVKYAKSAGSSILRDLGVLGNKHIPHVYLTSSRSQRLQLLAGLVDTDGHYVIKSRCYELVTKIPELAQQYAFLSRSLGFKATVNGSVKSCQTGATGVYYRVVIRGNLSEVPVKLEHKKAQNSKKNASISGFSVVDTGIDDYYGFTLDGDGLFLLGDFTVTHNTSALITIARHNIMRHRDVLWFTHEGVDDDLQQKMVQAVVGVDTPTLLSMYKTEAGLEEITAAMTLVERYLVYIPWNHPGMTVEELAPVIERRQEERRAKFGGKGFDLLVDDYPGLLTSESARGGRLEQRNVDALVYNYFVQLGLKHRFHVLCAIQTNREGSKANRDDTRLLTMEDVRESWDVMCKATNVVTINRDMRAQNKNRSTFYISKSRSGRVGRAVVCRSNFGSTLTHSEEMGATWYFGTQSLSDHIDNFLLRFHGKEISQEALAEAG